MKREAVNTWTLLLLVLGVSALFLSMIRQFLMAIFLAGIFSALFRPLFSRFYGWYGRRRRLASLTTIAVVVFVILLPLAGMVGVITAQAIRVGETVKPWVETQISQPDAVSRFLRALPFIEKLEPYRNFILTKAGETVGFLSKFLINQLSSATLGTVNFVFLLLIMLYTMYFFLMDGDVLLGKILYYLPLQDKDEQRLLERFTSVTRATLKGTAVIGILQGGLAGGAFAAVGISSPVFWGSIMAVLSVIPGIGAALVWAPAAFILAVTGHLAQGIGLALFCALVVGGLDNVLRPILVGKDTQMHELMIVFGTLGGIVMFGVAGIIIGPIVTALFVTVWDMYGVAFKDVLPGVGETPSNIADIDAGGAGEEAPSAENAREVRPPPR